MTLSDFIQRPRWALRQLLPLHYRTHYRDEEGRRHFVVWRMWLGRSFAVDDVVVADPEEVARAITKLLRDAEKAPDLRWSV